MFKKRVGILWGGFGDKTENSKKTRDFIYKNIDDEKFDLLEIEMSEENLFYLEGELVTLSELSEKVDIVFNGLCGQSAKDGKLQKAFEINGINFVGSSSISSALVFNPKLFKKTLQKFGIKTLESHEVLINKDSDLKKISQEIFREVPQPCVFKKDTNIGIFNDAICKDVNEIESVLANLEDSESNEVSVRAYLGDKAVSLCGISKFIDGKDEFYFAPFFTETGESIDSESAQQVKEVSDKVCKSIELSGYFCINFIVSNKDIFIDSVDSLPEIFDSSIFVNLLESYSIDYKEFITHLLNISSN